MTVRIVVEGLLLGALPAAFCAIGIRNGAVNMVFLYHADVQERCIRCGTCGNSDVCDYCVVGSENPMAKEYETVTDAGGFLVSRKARKDWI